MSYEDTIVKKPWGYEYLAYENEHVGLWFLYIAHKQATSMHCHPNKTTGLMVLDGDVQISFLSNKFFVEACGKMMIRKGLFHSTQAVSQPGAWVMEIETPVDKHDLVRFKDFYGREGKPYEDSTFEAPKKDDCLWLEDPPPSQTVTYSFANSKIHLTSVDDSSHFADLSDDTHVIFLRGGLVTDYETTVAGPGDIVSAAVLKKLMTVFSDVAPNTVTMIVEKEDDSRPSDTI